MTRFNPDDPKWTAYVLGELSLTDREAVEEELESSVEARSFVEELHLAAQVTESELRDQAPLTSLSFEERQRIRAAAVVKRRFLPTRPMVWAAWLAAVSTALVLAAGSVIVFDQRHRSLPIESTVAENRSPQMDSERESEPALLSPMKKSESSALPATAGALPADPPLAATASRHAPPPPPPAGAPRQSQIDSVIEEAVIPAPAPLNEPSAAAPFERASADQNRQPVLPADEGPAVSNASGGRAVVLPAAAGGRIFGTINDASAARIPGVNVKATNGETGTVSSAVTNEAGSYILDGLQSGTYQLKAELPGFETTVSTGVEVSAGRGVERDLTMQVGAAQGVQATVTADTVAASSLLATQGGVALNDRARLGSLPLAPPVSGFAPAIPILGAFDRTSADTVSVINTISENPFLNTNQNPISRFSPDMNPASLANVRQYLDQNQLPPPGAVGIEAMVNSFSYNYPPPSGNNLFGASIEAATAPWNPGHRLVRIGIKARDAHRRLPAGNTVAKEVKLEIEFNPAVVGEYRLINNGSPVLGTLASGRGAQDAGSVEAGQTFTVLYEIVPQASKSGSTRALTVRIRYKDPDSGDAIALAFPLIDRGQSFERASTDFRFAAAVASFGMVLGDSPYKGTASIDSTLAIAEHSMGPEGKGQRHEFLKLVERARELGVKRN